MAITSMLFLFCFLPLSFAVYYIANDEIKEYVLLVLSLLFYALGSLKYFLLFVAVVFLTVALGRGINHEKQKTLKKCLLILGILLNVGVLGYYKYADFTIATVNSIFGSEFNLRNILLPLGISFFTFKAISYLVDVYTKKIDITNVPAVHDALYLSFFAQIHSGPLTRYGDSYCVNREERKEGSLFSDGVFRFLVGFNKKVLLADILANITAEIFSNSFENFSSAYAWLGSICYSLQLFYDFAGYSDMAIGISEMFGYRCMENFNYPYTTESVSKFWRRWHISLSQWFRDYIYIPLGGSRSKSRLRVYFNLLVVWILTGIWHGPAWNFVFWGIVYFILIVFEKETGFPEKFKTKSGKYVYRILTLLFINCQWVFFRTSDLVAGLRYIKRMFIPTINELADLRTLFLIKDYFIFILAAIILCVPIVPWIGKKLEKIRWAKYTYELMIGISTVLLFVWAMSFVVSGQNNPFAYADF